MTAATARGHLAIAGTAWLALAVYPLTQLVVAAAWQAPAYDWRLNYISSLGNTACGIYGERFVCSPHHMLMNAVFVVTGLLMILGGLIFMRAYRTHRWVALGFGLQALGGLGAIIVGLVPENVGSAWHGVGAALPFFGGNLGLILLGLAAQWPQWLRWYTFLSGFIGLVALLLFASGNTGLFGIGGIERAVDGVHVFWMMVYGGLVIRKTRGVSQMGKGSESGLWRGDAAKPGGRNRARNAAHRP